MFSLQATAAVPAHADFAKVVGCVGGVGRFLIVIEMVAPAGVAGDDRHIDPEGPAGNVEGMDAVVGEFTATVKPVPMPVVVNEIILIGTGRNRALPEIVVEVRWNRGRLSFADGAALIVIPATGIAKLADHAVLELGNSFAEGRGAATLVSHLHLTIGAFRCGDHEFGLAWVMAAWFFHVDMLSRITAEDGGGGVPEIRRGNGENVDFLVFEDATEISDGFGCLAALFFGGKFGSGGEAVFVDVADVGDLDSLELGKVADVVFTPAQSL